MLTIKDCSPIDPQPNAEEAGWLRRLAASVHANDYVVPISGYRDIDDEPIVYCTWDGTWWAGRYVGSLSFEGRRLIIEPRFGIATLRNWLFGVTSVILTESPGRLIADDSFIAQLLASVWGHGFVQAARHGLPALRREITTTGATIRGRLDVAASIRLIASGGRKAASVQTERSLSHAASRAIVAAYGVLREWLNVPDEKWMPQRAKELISHLMSVTGSRPSVPTTAELKRVRYTPITAGFERIAELSRHIANHRGLTSDMGDSGKSKSVLLDVAEIWELYVLDVLRKAAISFMVKHGTIEKEASRKLLYSDVSGQGLSTLIPDAILYAHGEVQGVVDAKYKSLYPSKLNQQGPQRDDLYQMAAYLGRFASLGKRSTWGLLAYPEDPSQHIIPPVEQNSPWTLDLGKKVLFTTLPHSSEESTDKIRNLILKMTVQRL